LQLEIARFYQYTTPDPYETLARKHVIEQVRNHLRKWIPEYKVEVFGSERTGTGMPLSDIDFRLVPQSESLDPAQARLPPSAAQRKENIKILQKLYNKNFRKGKTYILPVVRHARYPLISAQDRSSGLDIQIVLANDTSISRVIMQDYMAEIPYLRELYWIVKTIFDTRGLSDVFRGGFGSYSLFMMVVASIKHAPKRPKDSAHALFNFLDFWGNFDTSKQGISIEPAFFYDKALHPVLTDTQKAKLEV
jgi:non-canonical poly(A) RNA polymerase PAPD5/7